MKVRFFDIEWDMADDGADSADLPKEAVLEVDEDCELAMDGADILSDKFGYCVHGFEFEVTAATGK